MILVSDSPAPIRQTLLVAASNVFPSYCLLGNGKNDVVGAIEAERKEVDAGVACANGTFPAPGAEASDRTPCEHQKVHPGKSLDANKYKDTSSRWTRHSAERPPLNHQKTAMDEAGRASSVEPWNLHAAEVAHELEGEATLEQLTQGKSAAGADVGVAAAALIDLHARHLAPVWWALLSTICWLL